MIGWALTFLAVALISAILGFGGLAGASAGMAQLLFLIFLGLAVATIVVRMVESRHM